MAGVGCTHHVMLILFTVIILCQFVCNNINVHVLLLYIYKRKNIIINLTLQYQSLNQSKFAPYCVVAGSL